jgi:hypothetical protein
MGGNSGDEIIEFRPIGKARRTGRPLFNLLNRGELTTLLVGVIRTKVYSETETVSKKILGAFRCEDPEDCTICDGYSDSNPFPALRKF